jgi:hypothetical protein
MRNSHADDAAVVTESDSKDCENRPTTAHAVQHKRGPHSGKSLNIPAWGAEVLDRFWSKVARGSEDECWRWIGTLAVHGYGSFRVPGTRFSARSHRVAYEIANGPLPAGKLVMHLCDNPACVNPKHLAAGTQQENLQDYWRKKESSLVPIDDAAQGLGIEPKRLRGYIFRNSVRYGDPIGDATHVYDWSLKHLRTQLAAHRATAVSRSDG